MHENQLTSVLRVNLTKSSHHARLAATMERVSIAPMCRATGKFVRT